MTQTTVQLFGDQDGEGGAGDHQPPGSQRRQGDGEQGGGQQGAAVGQMGPDGPSAQQKHQRLGE